MTRSGVLGSFRAGSEGSLADLLLSADRKRLVSARPNLPRFSPRPATAEIGRLQTSAQLLSTANVIAETYRTMQWAPWRRSERAGIRSSWSHPIVSADGKVMGTFAIYRHEVASPLPADLELIQRSAGLAAVALEREQHLQDQRLAQVVFEQSVEGIVVTDVDDRVLIQPAFERLPFSYGEMSNACRRSWTAEDGPEAREQARVPAARVGQGEVWGKSKTGEILPMHCPCQVRDGGIPPYIGILNDISDQKIQRRE